MWKYLTILFFWNEHQSKMYTITFLQFLKQNCDLDFVVLNSKRIRKYKHNRYYLYHQINLHPGKITHTICSERTNECKSCTKLKYTTPVTIHQNEASLKWCILTIIVSSYSNISSFIPKCISLFHNNSNFIAHKIFSGQSWFANSISM